MPEGKELERYGFEVKAAELADNYAAIVQGEGTAIERLIRVAGIAPTAMQVMEEARDTVERLRDENEQIKRQAIVTGADWQKKILDIHQLTLVDCRRQWRAVKARVDFEDFLDEVREVFGYQFASAFAASVRSTEG